MSLTIKGTSPLMTKKIFFSSTVPILFFIFSAFHALHAPRTKATTFLTNFLAV